MDRDSPAIGDWKRQLQQDIDLLCWWYECSPVEKREVIETARALMQGAVRCFRAMAAELDLVIKHTFR